LQTLDFGNWTLPQTGQRLPISLGWSEGQVNRPSTIGTTFFCAWLNPEGDRPADP